MNTMYNLTNTITIKYFMKLKLISCSVCILFCNWNIQTEQNIKKAEWLTGTWQNKTTSGVVYENWKKYSDELMVGKSYILTGKDTLIIETIALRKVNESLVYIPRLQNSNKTKVPARFTLKSATDNQLIFENKTHDFPQVISYRRINRDSLVAEISGTENGKTRKEIFPMTKVR